MSHRVGIWPILLLIGCTGTISMRLRQDVAPGNLNPVTYYTGFAETLDRTWTLLVIRGTGRFPASHDFGKGAEATLLGYSVVYPQKSYVDDERQYFRHDFRGQRLHDICAVMDDLIAHGAKHVLLAAISEGVMLAPEIAARYPDQVCGLICTSGSVFPFGEDLRYAAAHRLGVFAQSTNFSEAAFEESLRAVEAEPESVEKGFMGHPYKFWSSYLHYDPAVHLKSLSCPMLFLNGDRDTNDVLKQAETIDRWRREGVPIEQKVYPGLGHDLGGAAEAMTQDILDWVRAHRLVKPE